MVEAKAILEFDVYTPAIEVTHYTCDDLGLRKNGAIFHAELSVYLVAFSMRILRSANSGCSNCDTFSPVLDCIVQDVVFIYCTVTSERI
jgi:hypothetical protein